MAIQVSVDRLIDLILSLLRSDVLVLLAPFLSRMRTLLFPNGEGIYEVLDYEGTLELCDPEGKQAIYTKRQRVRFLQNNVAHVQNEYR